MRKYFKHFIDGCVVGSAVIMITIMLLVIAYWIHNWLLDMTKNSEMVDMIIAMYVFMMMFGLINMMLHRSKNDQDDTTRST